MIALALGNRRSASADFSRAIDLWISWQDHTAVRSGTASTLVAVVEPWPPPTAKAGLPLDDDGYLS